MPIEVKHRFVSPKGDGTDATLLRPSNWNDTHDIEMASGKMLGRLTAGPGDAEELPLTAYMSSLLGTADFAALAALLGLPTTGDAKLTFKTSPDAGWVMMNDGSIGDAGSGATYVLPTYNTQALFTLGFSNFSDAAAPLQTSAGGATTRAAQVNAANAWAAKCRMVLPRQLGRAIIAGGTGAGLTARSLGSWGGEENHVLTAAEVAKHNHPLSSTPLTGSISGSATGGTSTTISQKTDFADTRHTHNLTVTNAATGGSYAAGYDLNHTHTTWQRSSYLSTGAVGSSDNPVGNYVLPTSSGSSNTGGSGALDHLHRFSINSDTSIEMYGSYGDGTHKHNFSGTFTGSCTVNTWTGVTVTTTLSGTADQQVQTDIGHNNMQPYTAWNVMIKL